MILIKTYCRRTTREVKIGNITIGGDRPIAIQSMTNTPTLDTDASVAQIERIADAGADIVRLTAQTPAHAGNLADISAKLHSDGYNLPLVADIHFTPEAAFEAARHVEKVRINPGNFNIAQFPDLLDLCAKRGVALRIGVNHGSLARHMMDRYGDTPHGMVESALEFLRICRDKQFSDVVISVKASNVVVMTQTVRQLCEAMDSEGLNFPLHLGVTEAGDAEDGRIKSAVGIGSLLADGIGDTIRVSLTEDPEREVPVARRILEHIESRRQASEYGVEYAAPQIVAPTTHPYVIGFDDVPDNLTHIRAEHPNVIDRAIAAMPSGCPVAVTAVYPHGMDAEQVMIAASIDLGSLLLRFPLSAISIESPDLSTDELNQIALNILQATRKRMSKTEYIACPSCGRTLFDLQSTLARVKEATQGFKGLKIGVMGCIVNGPGEMADADFGYVGAGPGRVSLYKGKQCVEKNIPADEALPRLLKLIQSNQSE